MAGAGWTIFFISEPKKTLNYSGSISVAESGFWAGQMVVCREPWTSKPVNDIQSLCDSCKL